MRSPQINPSSICNADELKALQPSISIPIVYCIAKADHSGAVLSIAWAEATYGSGYLFPFVDGLVSSGSGSLRRLSRMKAANFVLSPR